MSMMKPEITDQERVLIDIVRSLPLNRKQEVYDFVRFVDAQLRNEELTQDETIEEIEADNLKWDLLMQSNDSQTLLNTLAERALKEYKEGKATPIVANTGGSMRPK